MLKNRNDLEKRIKIIIENDLNPRRDINYLSNKFKKHRITKGQVNDMLKGMNPFNTLSVSILCLLTKYLYEAKNDESIDYKKWFTEYEIKQADEFEFQTSTEESSIIVFENVTKDMEDDYSTVLTLVHNAELWEGLKIRYNEKTQRPMIVREYEGGTYKEPYLNLKTKSQITKRIIEGKQIPNTITLNVPEDVEIEYNEATKQLIIHGQCDIIDGYHRSIAAWFAYKQKPNINFYYKLRVVHWDIPKAKDFIHQESLGNKLDLNVAKSYDTSSPYNKIVNKINEAQNSYLAGKITSDQNEIKKGLPLIPFNVVFDTIKYLYPELEKDGTTETIKIQKKIIDGLNIIIENDPEILDTHQNNLLWVSFLIIIKEFGNESDIINMVNCIDKNTLDKIPYKSINKKLLCRIEEEALKHV